MRAGLKLLACLIFLSAVLVNRFAYLFLKNVRWEKNKKHRVGQRVGLDAVLLQYRFYVLGHLVFGRCLLLRCRLLGLLLTVCKLAMEPTFSTKVE
jgi:hypothetical protein